MKTKRVSARKAQVAVDFMLSYGIAILIITLSLYVVFRIGIFNTQLVPIGCTSSSSAFICDTVSLSTSSNLTMVLSQNTNGQINITGVACSLTANVSGNTPAYGNVHIMPYNSITTSAYYPSNALINGLAISSGSSGVMSVYCYGPSGRATGNLGNKLSGIVWINYTYAGLPSSLHTVEVAATFNTRYT